MLDLVLPLIFNPLLATSLLFQHLTEFRLVALMRDWVWCAARENWLPDLLQGSQLLYLRLLHPPFVQERVHNRDGSVHSSSVLGILKRIFILI